MSDREDNCQVQVLRPVQLLAATLHHFSPEVNSLARCIHDASQREAEVIEGLKSLRNVPKALSDGTAQWEEEDGLVYHKGKLYVPNNRQLQQDIVKSCHNTVTTGHPGKNGTLELVSRYYWWPCMGGFITAYVDGCDCCQ